MIPAFLKAVREVEPQAFLMENVPGLIAGDRVAYLSRIVEDCEDLGFTVVWKIVNAADYGVAQSRRRLFVIGLRGRRFRFPEPTHGPGRPLPHVAVKDVLPPHSIGELNPSRSSTLRSPTCGRVPTTAMCLTAAADRSTATSPVTQSSLRRAVTRRTSSMSRTSSPHTINTWPREARPEPGHFPARGV